jgi:hypothetical protein
VFVDSCTEHFSNPVQDKQQILKGVISFLLYSLNYPDMFRHPNAIFRGLYVPRKLLQFDTTHFNLIYIDAIFIIHPSSPSYPRTHTHTHKLFLSTICIIFIFTVLVYRQDWSSLRGTCKPLKMAFGCRRMSG